MEEEIVKREELRARLEAILDPYKEKQLLYDILDKLNIEYKKSNCRRCINDLYNIAREELGIILDASELSNFNDVTPCDSYTYLKDFPVRWEYEGRSYIIGRRTNKRIIEKFITKHKGFYICKNK